MEGPLDRGASRPSRLTIIRRAPDPFDHADPPCEIGRGGRRFARPQGPMQAAHLLLAHRQLLVRSGHVALGVGVEVVHGGQRSSEQAWPSA
jgi:hypothetical protein